MAQVAERSEKAEIAEVLARATRFFQGYEKFSKNVDTFMSDLRTLRSDVVQLLNAKEATDKLVKDAQIVLSKTEREAKTRLATVEMGHQALIDRLSKKEIELANKMADIERRDTILTSERRKYELLKEEYERKLAGMTQISAKRNQ